MKPRVQEEYTLQIYFSTVGSENLDKMRELRLLLTDVVPGPLERVYTAFDLVPSQIRDTDRVDAVTTITINRTTDDLFAFFSVKTTTTGMQHSNLWATIGKKAFPMMRVDVIGSGTEKGQVCRSLFTPKKETPSAIDVEDTPDDE